MAVDSKGDVSETPTMEAWVSNSKPNVQLPKIVTKPSKEESPNIILARRILSCKLSDRVYGSVTTSEPFRQRFRKDADELVRSPTCLVLGSRSLQRLAESTQETRGLGERQRSNLYMKKTDQKDIGKHERDRRGVDSGLGSSIDQKRVQCHFVYKKSKFYERRRPLSLPLPKDSPNSEYVTRSKLLTRSNQEGTTSKESGAQPENAEDIQVMNIDVINRRRNTKDVLSNLRDHPAITRKILRELDEKSVPSQQRTYDWLMKYTV